MPVQKLTNVLEHVPATLVGNAAGSKPELVTLEDREHLKVPAVMMTVGVHNGSHGPILYTAEEMAPVTNLFDHKPACVYHPEVNGAGVTACSPLMLNTRKVGVPLESVFEDDKWKTQVYLDVARTKQVDQRVLNMVQGGQKVEVSTGLYLDIEMTPGEWKGEKYVGIARNMRPDHLAILPDKVGACSIADGAGLLQNQAASQEPESLQLVLQQSAVAAVRASGLMAANEASFSTISRQLADQLAAKFGKPGQYWGGWIGEVFSEWVIFYDEKDALQAMKYTASDTGVTLVGDPVKVSRAIQYRTGDGKALVGNVESGPSPTTNGDPAMAFDKSKHLTTLIGNGYEEKDREWLSKLPDDQLERVKPVPAPVTNQTPPASPPPPPAPAPAPLTIQTLIANADPQTQAMLGDMAATWQAEKATLIANIKSVPTNPYSDEELNGMQNPQLRKLSALVKPAAPTTNQTEQLLQMLGAFPGTPLLTNADPKDLPPALEAPSMDNYFTPPPAVPPATPAAKA
jgi:hypothetical protein